MNAQGILDRIEQDARESAASMLREAQVKAEEIRGVTERKIDAAKEAAMAQAKAEASSLEDRMERMAQLDDRKDMLAAKRGVLDEAFARALDKMAAMTDEKARAFGLSMLLEAASGGETLVPDVASDWCDQSFVDEANAALAQAGKTEKIQLSTEKRVLGGGFILQRGGMEINCSYKAALDARRMDIEAEVASKLFE